MIEIFILLAQNDIRDFCKKCLSCQLRVKSNKCDDTQIIPVTHPDEAFHIINGNLIGPIKPSSGGFKYVLCTADQCTRCPEKGMIHNTIRENSRNWHKHIPFLLWAYRKVSNATTNVSTSQMLYDRHPRLLYFKLKSSWTNDTFLFCGQLNSVTSK